MIHLCQPTPHTGCSVCCGLFNFKKTVKNSLSLFLSKGNERAANNLNPVHPETIYMTPDISRDPFSHICPYQGFLSEGKPGCLLHPEAAGDDLRDRSLFGRRICEEFLCPAHYLLSEKMKTELIRHIDDWYLYSIAIIDPSGFTEIYNICSAEHPPDAGQDKLTERLKERLEKHARILLKDESPVFFYSVSEYCLWNSEKRQSSG